MLNDYGSAQSECSNWRAGRTARGIIILRATCFNWLLRLLNTLAKWIGPSKHSPASTLSRPSQDHNDGNRMMANTLSLLQELGYLYHIDDVSRDEPFIEIVNDKDFVVVPYTLRNNDISLQ
jgi:hypothetical protein